jgi:hypothetical protein
MKNWIRRSLPLLALIAACALTLPAKSFAVDQMRHKAGYTTAIEHGAGPVVESRQAAFADPIDRQLNRPAPHKQTQPGAQKFAPGDAPPAWKAKIDPLLLLVTCPPIGGVGNITGRVTDDNATANPIRDIYVITYDRYGSSIDGAYTDDNGTYTFSAIDAGSYKVRFDASYVNAYSGQNYISAWYSNKTSFTAADQVTVTGGETTPGINAQLAAPGGEITGTVTDDTATLSPIKNVSVYVYDTDGNNVGSGYTIDNGTYSVRGLSTGSYTLQFYPSGNYVIEWYDNMPDRASATPVPVTAGAATPNIDAQLAAGASMTGTVTDSSNNPIEHIYVTVYNGGNSSGDYTDDNGTYMVNRLPAGSCTVRFDPWYGNYYYGGNYLLEWYDNQPDKASATPVAVAAGEAKAGINAQLATGGSISGTVTDAAGGLPIKSIYVYATNGSNSWNDYTLDNGTYIMSGLSTGSYKVKFASSSSDQNYILEWYDNKADQASATPLAVTAGSPLSGIDAQLAAGGSITGRVTDETNSCPIPDMEVDVYDLNNHYMGATRTDDNGTYSVSGLPTGSYKVFFSPYELNYVPEWYDDQPSFYTANPVSVTAGATTTGIDAALAAGGVIAGRVTEEATGNPIQNIYVYVHDLTGNGVNGEYTDDNGTYTVMGLLTRTYTVEFDTSNANINYGQSYVEEWYDNQPDQASANTLSVTAGATMSGIDAALAGGGSITGRVTEEATGNAIYNIYVYVVDLAGNSVTYDHTDDNGTYRLSGLPTGSYKVRFSSSSSGQNYILEWYDNQPDQTSANPVSVTAGATTPNINAQLAVGTGTTTTTTPGGSTTTTTPGGSTTTTVSGGTTTVPATTTVSGGTTTAPATTTTTTSGRKWCPARQALGTEKSGILTLCYKLRDTRLAKTEAGRNLTALYYRNSGEISQILSARDGLNAESRRLLLSLAPNMFLSLFRNHELTITQGQTERIADFIKQLEKTASPGLQADLAGLLACLADGSLQREIGYKVKR